jgi:2-keto-4-pentenoate hydratase/2-oxohepta-3-ene-1,7-dioic acid hydratase in catechol pathway
MRIARFAAGGDPQFGIVELAEDGGSHPGTIATLTGDPIAMPVQLTGERHELDSVRLLAPVIPRSKIIGVGRNYVAHADELGNEVPETPLTFFKPNTSVIGPHEAIVCPETSSEVSYEGELAIVIGRICKEVPFERVPDVIFGYTVANDVTARDLQRTDGQWTRAKGYDTFCPLGPWITTHQSLQEVSDVRIRTTVDGEVRQSESTSLMVFSIPELIVHITSFTTLLPGDVILTGTPAGVGTLLPGQEVSVEVDGVGTLTNVVASSSSGGLSGTAAEAES